MESRKREFLELKPVVAVSSVKELSADFNLITMIDDDSKTSRDTRSTING